MKVVLIALLFAASFAASAQEITLKKLNAARTKFSATATDLNAILLEQIYEMKDEFDQACTAKVTGKKETWVILDIGTCVTRADLKDGDKFKLNPNGVFQAAEVPVAAAAPAAAAPAAAAPAEDEEARWQIGVGLGYQLGAADARFDNAEYYSSGTGTIKGEARLRYKRAFAIALEGRNVPRMGWGFIGGIQLEGEREFESGALRGGGVEVMLSGGSDPSRIQFTTLYGSAVFRWNEFYLPFGLNLSQAKFKAAGGFTGTVQASSGIGAQLGAGWRFSDLFVLEAYSWVTSFRLRSTSSTETLDYGLGTFSSLFLIGKFTF